MVILIIINLAVSAVVLSFLNGLPARAWQKPNDQIILSEAQLQKLLREKTEAVVAEYLENCKIQVTTKGDILIVPKK